MNDDWLDPEREWLGPRPRKTPEPPEETEKLAVVAWSPVRCPHCDSRDAPVTATRAGGLRYHRCRGCGQAFRSIESTK